MRWMKLGEDSQIYPWPEISKWVLLWHKTGIPILGMYLGGNWIVSNRYVELRFLLLNFTHWSYIEGPSS